MCLPLAIIPDEIVKNTTSYPSKNMDGYTLKPKNACTVYHKQVFFANKLLEKRLSKHGYFPVQYKPGLWKNTWRPVTSSLVVDDLGVKYTGKDHALHLINVLENDRKIDLDCQGKPYFSITLEWNYSERWLDLTVPGYIKKS